MDFTDGQLPNIVVDWEVPGSNGGLEISYND
jgi:hypothetical protein